MTTSDARTYAAAKRTQEFVGQTVTALQERYVHQPQPLPDARAALARLRRGVGKPMGQIPDLLEFTVDAEAPMPRDDAPTHSEVAAYTAMTLYALHQQSQSHRMHDQRHTFAQAVGSIRYQDGSENEGVHRRFQALATATGIDEFVQHTRGLITLLRGAERGFDYGRFAADLVFFQNPADADAVRLAWGRQFYRIPKPTDSTEEIS